MIIVILLFLLILIAGIAENAVLTKNIKRVPVRILVNGTRGKSTTVRLLTSAINECGIRTIGKSTGSEAKFLLPDGTEKQIDRKRGVNIVREQRMLFKLAKDNNCEAVVCECQALREENQRLYANKVFRPTIVAITNIRNDHKDVMGDNPEEVILKCVPGNAKLIFADENAATTEAENTDNTDNSNNIFSFNVHPQCLNLADKVIRELNLDTNTAKEGMRKAKGDAGHRTGYTYIAENKTEKRIINAFAVNDAESAEEILKDKGSITVIFSNRKDREFRIKEFALLFEKLNLDDIRLIGDNRNKCAGIMKAKAYGDNQYGELLNSAREIVVCCGNIGGSGKKFIAYLEENND